MASRSSPFETLLHFNFLFLNATASELSTRLWEVHRNSSHFLNTVRCIFKNKTTVASESRIKAMTLVTACRVGTPRAGILNEFPFCSFLWREELQIRSPLWTKTFKQEALLLASPAVSIPGDLASPSERPQGKGCVWLKDHEIPLLREALDTEPSFMKYTMTEVFNVPCSHDHFYFSGYVRVFLEL